MKSNKLMLVLLVGAFIFSMAYVSAANIGTFKLNKEMQITNYCATADCTYANISSIQAPDGTIYNLNEEMTQTEYDFNYTYTPTQIGTYSFKTCSNPNGVSICEGDTFEVTGDGFSSSLGFYIIIFVLVAGLIILGYSVQDYSLLILGGFGAVLFGLYILFYGIAGIKDPVYTWGLGIIILMVGGYFGIRAAAESIDL